MFFFLAASSCKCVAFMLSHAKLAHSPENNGGVHLAFPTDERPHCPSDPFCKILTSKVNGVRRNCCFFLLSFPTGARPRQPVYPAAGSSIKMLLPCVRASAHISPCAARRRTHCFVFASLRAAISTPLQHDTQRRRKCDATLCCLCAVN